MKPTVFLLLVFPLAAFADPASPPPAAAEQTDYWAIGATNPVPAGAQVTLATARTNYFIGENVLLQFILENNGATSFEASFGGDYRGASRQLRFKITATDEHGHVAEDPDPSPMCLGGLGGPVTLKPGEKSTNSIPLMRYCQIDAPGTYAIRVTHDFGWKEGERNRPVGETRITFRLPDAEEAEHIVARMIAISEEPWTPWDESSKDVADFTCLRHPVYLEPLVRRAQAGDLRAFEGLELIPTPDATAALLALASASDAALALAAAQALENRLPLPDSFRHPGFQSVRERLAEKSWRPEFAVAGRAVATNLLMKSEAETVALGARLLHAIGEPDEAWPIFDALSRALEPMNNPRQGPQDNILDFPPPVRELMLALDTLRARGYALGDSLSGNGQILFYFQALVGAPPPRPDPWLERLEAFGTTSRFPIHETAVRSIPDPLPPACIPFVQRALADPDPGVCRAACTVAGQSKNPDFLPSLLEIIATEHNEWLLRGATQAAWQLEAGFPLLETWADRLAEEKLYPIALDSLQTILDGATGNHSGRTDLTRTERLALRQAWQDFLALHEEEIRAGQRFKLNDPAVSPALVGRARRWELPDGSTWPASTNAL